MQDELAARHRAITLRLASRPVKAVCLAVGRSEVWFRKWWGRYLEAGPEGLYDLTRANHHVAQRISPCWWRRRARGRPPPPTRAPAVPLLRPASIHKPHFQERREERPALPRRRRVKQDPQGSFNRQDLFPLPDQFSRGQEEAPHQVAGGEAVVEGLSVALVGAS
jgi:hypothetical protein